MALNEKNIQTRIVLTHDDYGNLKNKKLKEGEVVLAKVGEITAGNVTQPVFMMKVGTAETTKTVEQLPWLMAPAADVYDWAKKQNLDAADLPAIPASKLNIPVEITGAGNAITSVSWDTTNHKLIFTKGETFATKGEFDSHNHRANTLTNFSDDVKAVVNTMGLGTDDTIEALDNRVEAVEGVIEAIKDDADIDSFADVKAELAKKQDTIPANTYDTFGSAANALDEAKGYVDGKFTEANLAQYTTEQEVKDIVDDVIAKASDGTTYDSLTALVDYIDAHGGDAAEMAAAIDALENKPGLDKVGTVTEVKTGTGLTGGPITSSGTIALSEATITSLGKADTAVQNIATGSANGTVAVDGTDVAVKGLGTAAYKAEGAFATAEQGTKADATAATIATYGDIVTHNVSEFATKAQGSKADTAVQTVSCNENTGLQATLDTDTRSVTIDFISDVVFVLDGGTAANLD